MASFYGGEGDDVIGGTPNVDLIKGYGGDDTLSGGNDVVDATRGAQLMLNSELI